MTPGTLGMKVKTGPFYRVNNPDVRSGWIGSGTLVLIVSPERWDRMVCLVPWMENVVVLSDACLRPVSP